MYLPAFLQSTNCTFLLASHSLLNAHSGDSTNHIKLFNFFSFLHINMNRSVCKTGCWLLLAQMFCKIVCNPFRKRPKCVEPLAGIRIRFLVVCLWPSFSIRLSSSPSVFSCCEPTQIYSTASPEQGQA